MSRRGNATQDPFIPDPLDEAEPPPDEFVEDPDYLDCTKDLVDLMNEEDDEDEYDDEDDEEWDDDDDEEDEEDDDDDEDDIEGDE